MPSDHELVVEAVAGDEDALSLLLERHGPHVRRALNISPKWQSIVDAEDIMQVTYLEAFMRIRKFDAASSQAFRAWLRRIAENNLRDAIRELTRFKRPQPNRRVESPAEASYVALIEQLSSDGTTVSRVASGREAVELIESALQNLPDDYQRVLRMFELDGRSGPQIAETMGKSHGAVKMLLARSRECLREQLGSPGQFFSDLD